MVPKKVIFNFTLEGEISGKKETQVLEATSVLNYPFHYNE